MHPHRRGNIAFFVISVKNSIFLVIDPNFISWGAKWMVIGPNGPGLTPQKPIFIAEKMLRILEIFLGKYSSPFSSTLERVKS